MAKAKETKTTKAPEPVEDNSVKLTPIKRQTITLRIRGMSPLIQHQWGVKALEEMRSKHAGKKTKAREIRNPEKEGHEAAYKTDKGKFGIPAMALKSAIISAAHKDIGVEKTLVRKALFLVCDDSGKVLPMDCDDPVINEDPVRVGAGGTDLRYRPYFHRWAVTVTFEIDAELLQTEDLLNLIDRAGFGVGICEWRPEKGGEYGRFEVDRSFPIVVK